MPRGRKKPSNPLDDLLDAASADVRSAERLETPDRPPATVPYHRLAIEEGHNPRHGFSEPGLRDLGRTILSVGIVQPLTVWQDRKDGTYKVIAGERRYRALGLLVEEGSIGADYPVPVYVREREDRAPALLTALVENLQREELHPLDEAEAFYELKELRGLSTGDIANALGCSLRHVQRRILLLNLADAVREAFRGGELSGATARELAGAPADLQLETLRHYRGAVPTQQTARGVRSYLSSRLIQGERALFDLAEYESRGGSIYVSDSGGKDPGLRGRYFCDTELFLALQEEALAAITSQLADEGKWVKRLETTRLPPGYVDDPDSGDGAVVLLRNGLFDVEVHPSVRRKAPQRPAGSTGETAPGASPMASLDSTPAARGRRASPKAPPEEVEPFSHRPKASRLARATRIRNQSLQDAIAGDPVTALRLAITSLLTAGESLGLRCRLPPDEQRPEISPSLARPLRALALALGLATPEELLAHVPLSELGEDAVYHRLRATPHSSLAAMFQALVAVTTGAWYDPDRGPRASSPPIVRSLVDDLAVQALWTPTAEYLEDYTRPELLSLAERFRLDVAASASKGDVIRALLDSDAIRRYTPPELAFRSEEDEP